MANARSTRWIDVMRPVAVCQRSLLVALQNNVKEIEDRLNEIGDDAQLANIDLQNMLQKQQQVVQMISNTSKLLQDTALAVIRKIG